MASSPKVKKILLFSSGILKMFNRLASNGAPSDDLYFSAGLFDLGDRSGADFMGFNGNGTGQISLGEALSDADLRDMIDPELWED